jgi:hypothetical protein
MLTRIADKDWEQHIDFDEEAQVYRFTMSRGDFAATYEVPLEDKEKAAGHWWYLCNSIWNKLTKIIIEDEERLKQ